MSKTNTQESVITPTMPDSKLIKEVRKAVNKLPIPEIKVHGVPLGYFDSTQLIKIIGNMAATANQNIRGLLAELDKCRKGEDTLIHNPQRFVDNEPAGSGDAL